MNTITKAELAKTISEMLSTHDNKIKALRLKKETSVDPYTDNTELFYERGKKRGLLNIAEKYELDLEF
jgi:hypothetical protein